MHPALIALIGVAATLAIGVAAYAMHSRSLETFRTAQAARAVEEREARQKDVDSDTHSRDLFRGELATWQIDFLKTLNGTYLRGELANVRFKALEDKVDRLDQYLTSDTGFRAAIRSDIGLLVKDHIDDLAKLIAALKPC